MLNAQRLDADQAVLVVIDLQAKLLPLIQRHNDVIFAAQQLLRGARIFELPVLATEQYPRGLGPTVPPVANLLAGFEEPILAKQTMSACGDEQVRAALRRIDRPQVVLCGIETHVCVQQTAMDLVSMDYRVFVCADACGSRRDLDGQWALSRMQQAGAVVTTSESVLFELCERCGTPRFKELLELIKASDARPG